MGQRNKMSQGKSAFQIIEPHPPAVSVKADIMPHRRVGTLCAIHTFANRTANTDCLMLATLVGIQIIRIDKIARMMNFAPEGNGKFRGFLANG